MVSERPSVVVVGYVCQDIVKIGQKIETAVGGAAYYCAVGAQESFAEPGIVSRVGKDFSEQSLSTFPLRSIQKDKKLPTAQVTLHYPNPDDLTDRQLTVERGASASLSPNDIPLAWLRAAFFHVATMEPTQQLEFVRYLRTYAPQATISVDSDSLFVDQDNYASQLELIFTLADIAFMNRQEFRRFGFLAPAIHSLIWKQDQDGASLLQRGQLVAHAKAPVVEVVNATGAGDYFSGSFIAGLARRRNYQDSLQQATTLASWFISRPR